jgi:tRNA modification GTPase
LRKKRDTIVACATPPGRGGVAVVRVSGDDVPAIGRALLGELPPPRHARFTCWKDENGEMIDAGLVLYFVAPQSYTGEHTLELHGHGGDVPVEALIQRIVKLGARRARPGEFTERAFLNDKIDLTQAEAIADLINATTQRAAQAALRSMQGEFSAQVKALRAALTGLRVYVEAAIDFPEEEIDFLGSQELRERLDDVRMRLAQVLRGAEEGAILARGLTIAIAGRPNAGKSTLMNALAGRDVAIVTDVAGTTRDVLRERVQVNGVAVELIDTAGLRIATEDPIEVEGIRRAREAIATADHLLFLVDAKADPKARSYEEERPNLPEGVPVTLVFNKVDLLRRSLTAAPGGNGLPPSLPISATTGQGLTELKRHIAAKAGTGEGGGAFSARARHVEALRRAMQHLEAAGVQLGGKQAEIAAFELREAQRELGEVVGDVTSDELLGQIFSSFCIGK